MNGFLHDGEGNSSSSRLLMVVGVVAILAVWAVVSIQTKTIQEVPWGIVGVVVTLVTGKQANSFFTEKSVVQQ